MITLYRQYLKHYTKSYFLLPDGSRLYALELMWLNNKISKSCIPENQYIIDRDRTGKMQYYRFRDSETIPRTSIEIHPANRLNQLEGCIAPCIEIAGGDKTANPVATDSIKACNILLDWFGDDSWVLEIKELQL